MKSQRNIKNVARSYLHRKFRSEFNDGAVYGAGWVPSDEREKGGYPLGFHDWQLERRNAWFAGFNVGYQRRLSEQ